jgi:hypothetical protein
VKKSTAKTAKKGHPSKKSSARGEKTTERRNFIHLNEGFSCGKCGKMNPKAAGTCRNHCRFCLFSRHVDAKVPGDRASKCQNLMEPVAIKADGKKGFQILHRCLECDKEIWNKKADDDELDAIIALMQRQNNSN